VGLRQRIVLLDSRFGMTGFLLGPNSVTLTFQTESGAQAFTEAAKGELVSSVTRLGVTVIVAD
jgi:hypothetical protein